MSSEKNYHPLIKIMMDGRSIFMDPVTAISVRICIKQKPVDELDHFKKELLLTPTVVSLCSHV